MNFMSKKSRDEIIHNKAIRLAEGGVVEVDGHEVFAKKSPWNWDPCFDCKMDCLCHYDTDMCSVCMELDRIRGCSHILVLANENK